jgi:predicted DCC family thiol-disulfide oxidoreductase YuxK
MTAPALTANTRAGDTALVTAAAVVAAVHGGVELMLLALTWITPLHVDVGRMCYSRVAPATLHRSRHQKPCQLLRQRRVP